MEWLVIFADDYEESLDRLRLEGSGEIYRLAQAVIARATTFPEKQPPLRGMRIRVMEEHSTDGFSAVRLYYFIEGDRVYFAHIEQYDDYGDEDLEAHLRLTHSRAVW